MIFVTESTGARKMAHLGQPFLGQTVILAGGAPTLTQQPLELLGQRGVLTAAINNAALHFQPSMWFCADNPNSFSPQILADPRIMKFCPMCHIATKLDNRKNMKFNQIPNVYFYIQKQDLSLYEALSPRMETPWYFNTLFIAFYVLYQLGCRRIILTGSDFEFSSDGSVYAHSEGLNPRERGLNEALYKKLIADLKICKPVFDHAGLTLMDASTKSKLGDTYQTLSLAEAVELCREDFPAAVDTAKLPHGTQFATDKLKKQLGLEVGPPAEWDEH